MKKRNIIVIGTSAGGFELLKKIIADIPADTDIAILIVWHMPSDVKGILPQVLNKSGGLHADHAIDGEQLKMGRIYIAPPDRHLVIKEGTIRVTKGPKENRFRPAIDPLFRSTAYSYGQRVIGVILSGALDDGAAGLWYIKNCGGIAIVQDPNEAEIAAMPENAIKMGKVDYILPVAEISNSLIRLSQELVNTTNEIGVTSDGKIKMEIGIALQDEALKKGVMDFGALSPYTCPECHGVLMQIKEGSYMRFRCHTGHAYSTDSLLALTSESIEDSLWNAIRSIEENILQLNHIGDHFAENNQPKLAAIYFKKAKEAHERATLVRQAVVKHELLTTQRVEQQAFDKKNN